MATVIAETPAQYERDLRSGQKEWKRGKDANVKWSYGATPPRQAPMWSPSASDLEDDDTSFKARPLGKPSDAYGSGFDRGKGNINKYGRTTGRIRELGNRRVRHKVSAQEEIDEAASVSRSILDYIPGSPRRQMSSPMDNVLYSFDRSDSPGRPLTLEVFVKTTGREMEKFVEKEYEIVDANGDMLKGRKARRNLRRGTAEGSKSADNDLDIDEDGFELV